MSFSLKMEYDYEMETMPGVVAKMKRLPRSVRDSFEDRELALQAKAMKASSVFQKIKEASDSFKESGVEGQAKMDDALEAMESSDFDPEKTNRERRAIRKECFDQAVLSISGFLCGDPESRSEKEIFWEFAEDEGIDELIEQARNGITDKDKKKSKDLLDS